MEKDILDIMKEFNENLAKAKELKKVSNQEITENAESNINDIIGNVLKLKMKIERVNDDLEEYKKEEDYLGKSESQRQISQEIYKDKIKELEEEKKLEEEKLENKKEEIEKQKGIENEIENLVKDMNEVCSAKNIKTVKDKIYENENEAERIELDYKIITGRIEEKIEAIKINLKQTMEARERLAKETSWDQDKYNEYTKNIEDFESGISSLEEQKNEKNIEKENKLLSLNEVKLEYIEFLNNLEKVFYGKNILEDNEENKEEVKEEKENKEVTKEETENKAEEIKEEKENKEEVEKEVEDQEEVEKEVEDQEEVEKEVEDQEEVEEQENAIEQEIKENKQLDNLEEIKNNRTNTSKINENEKNQTVNEKTSNEQETKSIIRNNVKISAKDDCVYIDGKKIENLGIAQSFNSKKEIFKKAKVKDVVKRTIKSSSMLKRIFVDPIVIARIKSKIDPVILNTLCRQEDKENDVEQIGDRIGMNVSTYIKSLHNKEELPIDLVYDLKQSRFDNKDFIKIENRLQNYARYADKITGVKVEGLKQKENIINKLIGRISTGGLLESGYDKKLDEEYKENGKDIKFKEFKKSLEVKLTPEQTKMVKENTHKTLEKEEER